MKLHLRLDQPVRGQRLIQKVEEVTKQYFHKAAVGENLWQIGRKSDLYPNIIIAVGTDVVPVVRPEEEYTVVYVVSWDFNTNSVPSRASEGTVPALIGFRNALEEALASNNGPLD